MPTAKRPSRFRLSPDVRPADHHLHLEPDLAASRFRGEVRIDVRLERPRAEIVLHAADLAIEHAEAEVDGNVVPLRARLDLLRKGGGLVDASGRGLVGVKGNSPLVKPLSALLKPLSAYLPGAGATARAQHRHDFDTTHEPPPHPKRH
jgi:peptidase M1-like protein